MMKLHFVELGMNSW